MIEKREFQRICAEKPELFGVFPESVLSLKQIEELQTIPRVAVGEIPGSGDFRPLYEILEQHRPNAFVPTLAYTGTEYGSWSSFYSACKKLKKHIQRDLNIYCIDPVMLGAPSFWKALNATFREILWSRFGLNCFCLGCRVYACALRIPLCKRIGSEIFLFWQRGQFGGCNYPAESEIFHYCRLFMAGFGIEVVQVKNNVSSKHGSDHDQKDNSDSVSEFLECVFAQDFRKRDETLQPCGSTVKFFESYAMPAVARIISKTLAGIQVNYTEEIQSFI